MRALVPHLFTLTLVALCAPPAQAIMAPDSPVHERLKTFEDHFNEHYGPQANQVNVVNPDTAPDAQAMPEELRNTPVADQKRDEERLKELMQEFDTNKDGNISADELAEAKNEGKDKELLDLLYLHEARLKLKRQQEANEQASQKQNPPVMLDNRPASP